MSFQTRMPRDAFAAAALAAATLSPAFAQTAAPEVATVGAEALVQENWRGTIARTDVPHEGCFEAEFPNAVWVEASCTVAPDKVCIPHGRGGPQTVGNGVDDAAPVTNPISATVGTFPTVTGVTSEKDGSADIHPIQLNSNFMSTAGCNGHSGVAVSGGNDTLVFTTPTKAYSTTGKDSVTCLAAAWKQSEFDIIGDGDGDGSKATFNKGSSITVKVAVTHGSTAAPTGSSNAGTTGETNNLTLGTCSAVSGATPCIQFKESN